MNGDEKIIEWRPERKKYLKHMKSHNDGHAIKLTVRPVRDFVNEVVWEAVSRKKLKSDHRTKRGEEPNHAKCAEYFTGTGEYKDFIARGSSDPMKAIRLIKYERGRAESTNEDRWNIYIDKVYKVLERIPAAQKDNRVFNEILSKHLRTVLRPTDLREYVRQAYATGVHPGSRKYNPVWQQQTRYSITKTEAMIEDIVEYLDTRAKEGLWELKWDDRNNSNNTQEICKN